MPQYATSDPLLQPFRLKHLTLKNRIMSTSHACGLVEDGMPSERYQRYHEAKAKGGLALTMFGGSSNISPESAWQLPQINLYDERVVEHFQRFSRRIHAHGAALMCQVSHVGGRGEPYAGAALAPIGPSPVRETLHRAFAKEMDEHDIARVVSDFAEAAARCKEGGLDGIETFAGAHLIGQFLSPATNRRSDRYGGSVENRCRFGLMVHEAIRKRVGDDFIVGIRFVIDEAGPHHLTFEDGLKIAAIFEASGTIDFFNAIYGRIDTELKLAVDCMPGMASAEAPFLARAGAFKQAVGLPVFHATRITSLETARRAIRDGLLDMVAMTRAHIADPDLVAKLARGEEERVRPCVGATHCMSPLRPTCIHNPSTGHEGALPHPIERAATRRRVLVAGGGPAGLEAARVCAERGHDVRLCEASDRLGGQVLLAAQASWRSELAGIVEWRPSRAGKARRGGLLELLPSSPARSRATPMSSSSRPEAFPISTGSMARSTAPASGMSSRTRRVQPRTRSSTTAPAATRRSRRRRPSGKRAERSRSLVSTAISRWKCPMPSRSSGGGALTSSASSRSSTGAWSVSNARATGCA